MKKGSIEVIDIDFVGHYIFETLWVGDFPAIGLNYTSGTEHNSIHEAIGVVFGGGIHRNFGKVSVFAEYVHVEN